MSFTFGNNKKIADAIIMNTRGNPLPILVGFLVFQVSGWFVGKRIFSTSNSEAMLFAFLAGGVIICGWLYHRMDEYSANTSYIGRALWWSCVVIGITFGLYFRFAI